MTAPLPRGVFDVLDRPLAERPDALALITRSARLTYRQLDQAADRAAAAWATLGVTPGDRIGVALPNDVDIVVAFHGAMRLGAIWVGINRALAHPEKAYMLADAGATVALMDDETVPVSSARLIGLAEWRAAVDQSDGGEPAGRPATPDPTAAAAIAYTSGTTGFPKGAVHCQAGLILPGAATVARRGWGPDLRKADSFPLTILNMLTLTTLLTAQAGGTGIIIDQPDVTSIVEWIQRERPNVWNGPPPQLHTMVHGAAIDPNALASLDEVWVGGADCPDRLRDDFEARFEVRVTRSYGLTEAPALVCLDDLDGDRPEGTCGRTLDHIKLELRDDELCLSAQTEGPWAGVYRPLIGYWNQPGPSAEVLADGVLHTGDLGSVTAGGHIRVAGRRSTMINRGGANVYPAEVERVLADAPGVNACSVVGFPDERLGERVGAAIEPRAGETPDREAILAHCRAALAAYKVPERLVIVDVLPRNQMGKVPREEVLRLFAS